MVKGLSGFLGSKCGPVEPPPGNLYYLVRGGEGERRFAGAPRGQDCYYQGCRRRPNGSCPGHLGCYALSARAQDLAAGNGDGAPCREDSFCCQLLQPLLAKEFKKRMAGFCREHLSWHQDCSCKPRCISSITTPQQKTHVFILACSPAMHAAAVLRVPEAFRRVETRGGRRVLCVSVLGLHYLFAKPSEVQDFFTDRIWIPGLETQKLAGLDRKVFHGRKQISVVDRFGELLSAAFRKAYRARSFDKTSALAALLVSAYGGRDLSMQAACHQEQAETQESEDTVKVCRNFNMRGSLRRLTERGRYPQWSRLNLQNGAQTFGVESEPVAGVSLAAAMSMAAEMSVGRSSLAKAFDHFRRGPLEHPGCLYVILRDGRKVWLRAEEAAPELCSDVAEACGKLRRSCWAEVEAIDAAGRRHVCRTGDNTFEYFDEENNGWQAEDADRFEQLLGVRSCVRVAVRRRRLVLPGLERGEHGGDDLVLSTAREAERFLRAEVLVLGRHLCDGDSISATRSPFNSAQSLMSFPVKVLLNSWCCRLHCIIMPPIDGDFDGDTMLFFKVIAKEAAVGFGAQTPAALLCYRSGALSMGAVLNGTLGLHYLAKASRRPLPSAHWVQALRCFPSYRLGLERFLPPGDGQRLWADTVTLAVLSVPCNGRYVMETAGSAEGAPRRILPFMPTIYGKREGAKGARRAAVLSGLYQAGEPIDMGRTPGAWHRQLLALERQPGTVMAVLINLQNLGVLFAHLHRARLVLEQFLPRPKLATAQDAVLERIAALQARALPEQGLPEGYGVPAVLPQSAGASAAEARMKLHSIAQGLVKLVTETTWKNLATDAVVAKLTALAEHLGPPGPSSSSSSRSHIECSQNFRKALMDLRGELNAAAAGDDMTRITSAWADLLSKQKLQQGALELCCGAPVGELEERYRLPCQPFDAVFPASLCPRSRMSCSVSLMAEHAQVLKAHDGAKSKVPVELMAVARRCVCSVLENLRQDEAFGHLWGPRLKADVCLGCWRAPQPSRVAERSCPGCAAPWTGKGANYRVALWLAAPQVPLTLAVQPCLSVEPSQPAAPQPLPPGAFLRPPRRPAPPDAPADLRQAAESAEPTPTSLLASELLSRLRSGHDGRMETLDRPTMLRIAPPRSALREQPLPGELLALHADLRPLAVMLFPVKAMNVILERDEGWHAESAAPRPRLLWTRPSGSVPVNTPGRERSLRVCAACGRPTEHIREFRRLPSGEGERRRLVGEWICEICTAWPGERWSRREAVDLYPRHLRQALLLFSARTRLPHDDRPVLRVELDARELLRMGVTSLHAALLQSRLEREFEDCRCFVVAWDAPGLQRSEVVLVHLYADRELPLRLALAKLVKSKACGHWQNSTYLGDGQALFPSSAGDERPRCSTSSSRLSAVASARARSVVGSVRCCDDYPALCRLEGIDACMRVMVRDAGGDAASAYGGSLLLAAARCVDGRPLNVSAFSRRCSPLQQLLQWGCVEPLVQASLRGELHPTDDAIGVCRALGALPRLGVGAADVRLVPEGEEEGQASSSSPSAASNAGGTLLSEAQKRRALAALAADLERRGGVTSEDGDVIGSALRLLREGRRCFEVVGPCTGKRKRVAPEAAVPSAYQL